MSDKNESNIGEAIDRLLKAYRLEGKLKKYDVYQAWRELLGEAVSKRTEKLVLQEKTLIVFMNSSVMRDELSQAETHIITMLNEKLGEKLVEKIWFR